VGGEPKTAMTSSPWQGKYGPLLIAEIGGNHEGDFDYARRLATLAIGAGVDVVKFQLYRGDTLVSPVESPDRNQHFKKFELAREQHLALADQCRDAGVRYLASVWDLEMLEWIDPCLDMYKIGSGDLTAYPVIRELARRGKPILLATGLATLREVTDAVGYLQSVNARYRDPDALALLQCTSMYPIAAADANLQAMDTLRKATGLTVGYSDHTEGTQALALAVAMGAQILEFHFTDSRDGKSFRDHKVSLTPPEVATLIREIGETRVYQGDGVKRPLDCERDHVVSFRRAVYPARDLPAGAVLGERDLICLRPNHGIDAREYDRVVGCKARVELKAFRRLDWSELERTGV
jgi:sialic acid synthase SpsE